MKKQSIKTHLRKYSIVQKRITTINHAFASAIAPNDDYSENKIHEAIKLLGQEPDGNLLCFYCDKPAETWDHVYGLVKDNQYYGYGHVMGNLLPSCKKCNSEKGNQGWESFINKKVLDSKVRNNKISALKKYLKKFLPKRHGYEEIKEICSNEVAQYEKIKKEIVQKMTEADFVAEEIRKKIKQDRNT